MCVCVIHIWYSFLLCCWKHWSIRCQLFAVSSISSWMKKSRKKSLKLHSECLRLMCHFFNEFYPKNQNNALNLRNTFYLPSQCQQTNHYQGMKQRILHLHWLKCVNTASTISTILICGLKAICYCWMGLIPFATFREPY